MDVISHKGFRARVEFDAEDSLFVGILIDIDDIVGFHAESMEVLRAAFEEAVDDYLAIRADQDRRHLRAQLLDGARSLPTASADEEYFRDQRQLPGQPPPDTPV